MDKDYVSAFSVMLDGKQNKTFCKLVINTKRKTMTLLGADKSEEAIDLETVEDTYKYKENVLKAIKSYEKN